MARAHWLVKSEPGTYPWSKLVSDGRATWDGIRNFQARGNLRLMKVGDLALYYHSGEGKEVVGVARITREAYQDPTTAEDWSVVDLEPVKALTQPVSLSTIKGDKGLANMALVRQGRLSVAPVKADEFARVLALGKTKLG